MNLLFNWIIAHRYEVILSVGFNSSQKFRLQLPSVNFFLQCLKNSFSDAFAAKLVKKGLEISEDKILTIHYSYSLHRNFQ